MMSASEIYELKKAQSEQQKDSEFLGHNLEIGKYDIHFAINILKTILIECQAFKMNSEPLYRTLDHSIKRLLAMLEVERDQMSLSKLHK